MGSKGKPRSRTAGRARMRRQARDFDSEFDLVQNNGRVTLPGLSKGALSKEHVAIFVVISILVVLGAFFARK